MDSILSVQNEDFSGDGKEFTTVPRAVTQAKSYLCRQLIHWILENLVKIYHGVIELQHLIDPRRRVKEGTSAVLLQSGLDEMVVG